MKILVVEDEHRISAAIKKGLEQELHIVDSAYDGESGFDLASSESYDLIILDLMLPKMDGLTVCRNLRTAQINTPILVLTAKGQIDERVQGLDAGADDYLLKPFAFAELLARVRSLTRRPPRLQSTLIQVGDLQLDPVKYLVLRGGHEISLTHKEFTLLEFLVRNAGQILTKESIISHCWDYDADVLDNTVEVYIRTLRRKLGRPDLIYTARGFGYQLGI